ncbi:DUF5615 family PIN-like protein [[Limnothrix rosea] IAM M-220]|uniref:DUF5615 family PIN-like protein n=1 Tax=[Limnothrix rosea] IAM M-220 TaxID=454133 RepID=UPI00095AF581|nr:DUF5615 family PIN-like protein [[Limnothrix rosea] IAM M-220]OKH18431.1 hypothetical protein NIES208_05565 [[Limnothrix rosea] IAM M-220]
MKILLDECIDRRLTQEFAPYSHLELETVRSMGWTGIKNGQLLKLVAANFDVFITVDQGMRHEQNLKQFELIIVILKTFSNRLTDLREVVPQIVESLDKAERGKAILISQT